MVLIVKAALTFLLIAMIHGFLERYPLLSGYVAVFPVVTFISLAVLTLGHSTTTEVSGFLQAALSGVVITGMVLGLMTISIRAGLPVTQTVLLGLSLWFMLAFGLVRIFEIDL